MDNLDKIEKNLNSIAGQISEENENVKFLKDSIAKLVFQVNEIQNEIQLIKDKQELYDMQNKLLLWCAIRKDYESAQDVKKRFFLSLPKAEDGRRTKQLILLKLLREVDTACRQNNLSYWLDFGSLLGAVRHHGFIPWDDDADLGMMRADAEKLKEILSSNPNVILWNYYCIDDFNLCNILRVKLKKYDCPVFLDIFIYDFCRMGGADAWGKYLAVRKALVANTKTFKNAPNEITPFSNERDGIFRTAIVDQGRIKQIKKFVDKSISDLSTDIGLSTDKNENIIWGVDNFTMGRAPRSFEYSQIFPLKEEVFEDVKVFIPNQYDLILKNEYGNIYKLPSDMISHEHIKGNTALYKRLEEIYRQIIKE